MEERRKSKRLSLEAKLIMRRLDNKEEASEVGISVTDISKTGLGFTCSETLTIGAVYESYITIWTKETLHAFIEIVRIEKKADTFVYGSIFIGMPESDLARISVYETVNEYTN